MDIKTITGGKKAKRTWSAPSEQKFSLISAGDGKETELKMKNFQCRGGEMQEMPKTVSGVTRRNVSSSAETEGQICKSNGHQEVTSVAKENKFQSCAEIPPDTQRETATRTGPKIPLASRYGRPYGYKIDFGMNCTDDAPSVSWGKTRE